MQSFQTMSDNPEERDERGSVKPLQDVDSLLCRDINETIVADTVSESVNMDELSLA